MLNFVHVGFYDEIYRQCRNFKKWHGEPFPLEAGFKSEIYFRGSHRDYTVIIEGVRDEAGKWHTVNGRFPDDLPKGCADNSTYLDRMEEQFGARMAREMVNLCAAIRYGELTQGSIEVKTGIVERFQNRLEEALVATGVDLPETIFTSDLRDKMQKPTE